MSIEETIKYRVTLAHDDFDDGPPESAGMFQLHSFNDRHLAYTDPKRVLACVECGEMRNEWVHSDAEIVNDGDFRWADWAQEERAENPDEVHAYVAREGFLLSYFEHGLCRWGLSGSMSGMPDFRWDGVEDAGFLEVNPDGQMSDHDWWLGLDEDRKIEIASNYLDEYTSWANGDVWGYTIETLEVCDHGKTHSGETIDSCWGFIGSEWFMDAVREALPEDATETNTEIADEYGVSSYTDLFAKDGSIDLAR